MKKALTVLLIVATVMGMVIPAMANPFVEPIAVAKNSKEIAVDVSGIQTATSSVNQEQNVNGDVYNWALGYANGGNLNAVSAAQATQTVGNNDSLGGCNGNADWNAGNGSGTGTATSTATGTGGAGGNGGNDNMDDSGNGGSAGGAAASAAAAAGTGVGGSSNGNGGNGGNGCNNAGFQAANAGPTGNDNMINGPEGFSGDVSQMNMVDQIATASLSTDQHLTQPVVILDAQVAASIDPATQSLVDNMLNEDDWMMTTTKNIDP